MIKVLNQLNIIKKEENRKLNILIKFKNKFFIF